MFIWRALLSVFPTAECLIPGLHPKLLLGDLGGQRLQWLKDSILIEGMASVNFWQIVCAFKNWSIVAIYHCVSFCWVTKWISQRYTYISSFLDFLPICCCCSVAKLCPTLCDCMDCSTPGFPSFILSLSLLRLACRSPQSIEWSSPCYAVASH